MLLIPQALIDTATTAVITADADGALYRNALPFARAATPGLAEGEKVVSSGLFPIDLKPIFLAHWSDAPESAKSAH